jgi:SAM-dependent methyltransferase
MTGSTAVGARTLLDIGCGLGLTLALLAEARRAHRDGRWPSEWPPPAGFEHIVGIELRGRVARVAAAALAGEAEVVTAHARDAIPSRVDVALLFDVLHMMRPDEQEALLGAIALNLTADGVVLIREADAAARWRFDLVRLGNRLRAVAQGSWRQRFHFRSAVEWQACLAAHGLRSEIHHMSRGTPFANVLLVVTRHHWQAKA